MKPECSWNLGTLQPGPVGPQRMPGSYRGGLRGKSDIDF